MKTYTKLEQAVYQSYYDYCALLSANTLSNELLDLSINHWKVLKAYTTDNDILDNDIKIRSYAVDICTSIFGKYQILSIDEYFNCLLSV